MKTENSTRFGFAQTVITPDAQAVYLDGFGERITPAEGVRDPLYVKAFVICAGSFRYALAVFDACGFEKRIALGLKRSIARRNGLTPDCVTVCATHTHSAPASGVLGDLPINYYLWDQIGMCAALTVQEAFQTASPCSPVFLRGDELSLMGNRRGRELCDRRIKICGFYDTENSLKGALVLASCHATCSSGMLLSADYPSVLTQAAQEKYPGVPFLFLQGRGADADPLLPDELGDDERIAALGGELADKVLSALENFENDGCVSACAPQLASVTVKIPMLPYPPKAVLQKTIDFFEEKRGSAEDSFESRRIVREIFGIKRLCARRLNGKKRLEKILCLRSCSCSDCRTGQRSFFCRSKFFVRPETVWKLFAGYTVWRRTLFLSSDMPTVRTAIWRLLPNLKWKTLCSAIWSTGTERRSAQKRRERKKFCPDIMKSSMRRIGIICLSAAGKARWP